MQLKISKVYGNSKMELVIDANDIKQALLKASIFTQSDICSLCQSTQISLDGNKTDEGHIYIKRKCAKCGACSTLGTYKSGDAYFWKKFEKWEGKKQGYQTDDNAPAPTEELVPDDLPF